MGEPVPFLDLGGQRVALAPDMEAGSAFGFSDITGVIASYGKLFWKTQQTEFAQFLSELREGQLTAILTAVLSLGLGGMLAFLLILHVREPSLPPPGKAPPAPPAPRDYTPEQLRAYDGTDGKPVLVALCGIIYDLSGAADLYGPGAAYSCFAGRDATRAMARFSFEEEDLANPDISDLGPFERSTLDEFVQKFKYFKCYPQVGRLVTFSAADRERKYNLDELSTHNGRGEVPEGRTIPLIYIAVSGRVFDVSMGGSEMYAPGSPYESFAGSDATIALAKMKIDTSLLNLPPSAAEDLSASEQTTLNDWISRYEKKYPIVGTFEYDAVAAEKFHKERLAKAEAELNSAEDAAASKPAH